MKRKKMIDKDDVNRNLMNNVKNYLQNTTY